MALVQFAVEVILRAAEVSTLAYQLAQDCILLPQSYQDDTLASHTVLAYHTPEHRILDQSTHTLPSFHCSQCS